MCVNLSYLVQQSFIFRKSNNQLVWAGIGSVTHSTANKISRTECTALAGTARQCLLYCLNLLTDCYSNCRYCLAVCDLQLPSMCLWLQSGIDSALASPNPALDSQSVKDAMCKTLTDWSPDSQSKDRRTILPIVLARPPDCSAGKNKIKSLHSSLHYHWQSKDARDNRRTRMTVSSPLFFQPEFLILVTVLCVQWRSRCRCRGCPCPGCTWCPAGRITWEDK